MPVVVTGASGGVGRVLIPMLSDRGEVRAVVRRQETAEPLRSSGAKVATCDLEDTPLLVTVMSGAHTVIHLAGGLDFPTDQAYEDANLGTTRDALQAAGEAGVARFLFLSYPGAAATSTNVYLRAKGLAEDAVRSSGLDHMILRSTHVYGRGQRWFEQIRSATARLIAVPVIGNGHQRIAPTHVRDVAEALLAADDRAEPVSGTRGLQGPDVVTADELVDLVAGRPRRKIHLSPRGSRRAARLLGRSIHPAMLELLAEDCLADAPDAAPELGVTLTPLVEGLAEVVPATR